MTSTDPNVTLLRGRLTLGSGSGSLVERRGFGGTSKKQRFNAIRSAWTHSGRFEVSPWISGVYFIFLLLIFFSLHSLTNSSRKSSVTMVPGGRKSSSGPGGKIRFSPSCDLFDICVPRGLRINGTSLQPNAAAAMSTVLYWRSVCQFVHPQSSSKITYTIHRNFKK